MTGNEMVKYINALSSSINPQKMDGNFGIGAKIATVTRNHAGVRYLSWKSNDEEGSSVVLWRDPITGAYGLKQLKGPNDEYGHWVQIDDHVKPADIKNHGGHGTKVLLHGNFESENTMQAPEGAPAPSRWVANYLNTRYFSIPEGITIRAREGWENPSANPDSNHMRTVTGMKSYLMQHAEGSGSVDLTGGTAHWWILRDESALHQNSGYINSSGHIAALYHAELYETSTGTAGNHKLQQFGILYGPRRIVIYVEPTASAVTTNTARTFLIMNGSSLPWSTWAIEFRESLPDQIHEYLLTISDGPVESDKSKAILDRLTRIKDLFQVSKYRPRKKGNLFISKSDSDYGGTYAGHGTSKSATKTLHENHNNGSGLFGGDVYDLFSSGTKLKGEETNPNPLQLPVTKWVSVEDGTREPDDMTDRAARYLKGTASPFNQW